MAAKGIACNVHFKPLPMFTAYQKLGFNIADFPNAYAQYCNEITLPTHTLLTEKEVQFIISSLVSVMKGLRISAK
jgi:dTDP-4-amino-4,6-dideoxygalactose transaminase